ncbi:putative ubiquitinyl hydrolase 1 [Helianthus annuus]|nr:putative ubiquitinyl hydrolase 1 [Helianthus annuus]
MLALIVLVVVAPVIVLVLRRKWRQAVARSEEVQRLLVSVSEESARVEFEAREEYYYTVTATAAAAAGIPSARVPVSTPAAVPAYGSVPFGSPLKLPYQCAVCFSPTTTRCAKCKAVRYCSGKCQILHWRQGHKAECRPYVAASPINNLGDHSNRQGDRKDSNDSLDTEAKQTATPTTFKDDKTVGDHSNRQGDRKDPNDSLDTEAKQTATLTTFKDDKTVGGLSSSKPGKSNDVFSNTSTTPDISKSGEVVSSSTSRHISHSTKPVKVDTEIKRVTTCSSQLTKNSRSVRSGSKSSKLKVVDHLKPTKWSRQESLEGGCDISHRYSFKGLFPYEMFVKLYQWKQFELQPFGLNNCGNSCYANAVLQCLVYTPPLTAYLLEGLHSKACDKRERCFTCELEGLVMKAKDGNSPLSPVRILTHIENIGSNLGHGKEEDAHEFLRYVIDALQSACIKEAKRNLNSFEEETTLIGLTFGGYLRSKIICMKCGGKSELHERMMDLTVEIEGDIRTLEDALDKFTCTEILDGENKYKCSRCKSYEKAKKKLTLLEAPNVLTIALKRFQSGKFGKLNKPVHFPDILDMAPYVSGTSDKSPIYRLYGVVVHVDMMNAAFSGHYVCYVKNLQNRWFMFDDSMVNEVDLQHVLTKGAYMLLYARCSPRAPRSIRSSLINHHDSRKDDIPPLSVSRPRTTEPWDACNYHPQQVHHRSLEEESSSSDNSGFFSESCSCSTESTHRDSSSIEDNISGDWAQEYHKTINLNSSDSDTSSTSSSPLPLYSRRSHLYASTTNGGSRVEADRKSSNVCRNLDCSCNCCSRVTNLDKLGGSGTYRGVTSRRSATRRNNELKY